MWAFLKWVFSWTGTPEPTKKSHELEKGIPKPSHILAGMICAYVLQHIENICADNTWWVHTSLCYDRYVWTYENIEVYFNIAKSSEDNYWNRIYEVKFNDKIFKFDEEENDLLINKMLQALKLKEERAKQKAFYEREQLAVDLIEGFFNRPKATVKEQPKLEDMSRKAQIGYERLRELNYNYAHVIDKSIYILQG